MLSKAPSLALSFALSFVLCNAAFSAEIYRWTDDKGKVHFGDKPNVPPGEVKRVDTGSATVTPAQRREAEMRAARERNEAFKDVRSGSQTKLDPRGDSKKAKCEEEWRRFNEASACFNAYRVANGLRAGAANCPDVKQPEPCN